MKITNLSDALSFVLTLGFVQKKEDNYAFVKNRLPDINKHEILSLIEMANFRGLDVRLIVEAIMDASAASFERLKELGIRAHRDVAFGVFKFKGEVKWIILDTKEITQYLISIHQEQL